MDTTKLMETIIATFKDIANFGEREYTTDERDNGCPQSDMITITDEFDSLMVAFDSLTIYPANTKTEFNNALFICDINRNGLDNSLMDYATGDLTYGF